MDIVTEPVRDGTKAYRTYIPKQPDPNVFSARRAEIDDGQFGFYTDDTYWYGVSYNVPNHPNWTKTGYYQFVGQMRISNLRENKLPSGRYDIANAEMRDGIQKVFHGGSGHHLLVNDGRWQFLLLFQDLGVGSCFGSSQRAFDLGAVDFGKWTDFVIQGKWSHLESQGALRIWKRVEGELDYKLVCEFYGTTWFDTYAVGSGAANRALPGVAKVNSPNLTAGLYYGSDGLDRELFIDEIRVSDFPSDYGFEQVKAVGRPDPIVIGTQPTSTVRFPAIPADAPPPTTNPSAYNPATDEFTLRSVGTGIGGTSDKLRFTYLTDKLVGDGEIIARIDFVQPNTVTGAIAQAGLMLRTSIDASSPTYAVSQASNNVISTHYRGQDNPIARLGATVADQNLGISLRIVRFNNTLKAYYSANRTRTGWKLIESRTLDLGEQVYVGLYTASGNDTDLTRSEFMESGLVRSTGRTAPLRKPGPSGAVLRARFDFDNSLTSSASPYFTESLPTNPGFGV